MTGYSKITLLSSLNWRRTRVIAPIMSTEIREHKGGDSHVKTDPVRESSMEFTRTDSIFKASICQVRRKIQFTDVYKKDTVTDQQNL